MDFNFNERNDSKQLSDKIIESVDQLFKLLLSDDFVQKFLMNGEINDNNRGIAHRRIKDFIDSEKAFKQNFVEIQRLTHIEEEKTFFEVVLKGLNEKIAQGDEQLQKLFGKPDTKLMEIPITTPIYGYNNMMYNTCAMGQFINVAVMLLVNYQLYRRLNAYLKQNSNYKPNKYSNFFCFENYDLDIICDQLRAMIDRRGDQVSEKVEQQLSELAKRMIVYERAFNKHEYSGAKWFDG